MWRRLSIFAGGFALAAAEAVCSDEWLPAVEVLDRLSHLVDKSLVVAETHGPIRDWFLAFVEEAPSRERSPSATEWFASLELDYGNLRAAIEWSLSQAEWEKGFRIGAALGRFWDIRGWHQEAYQVRKQLLEHAPDDHGSEARAVIQAHLATAMPFDPERTPSMLLDSLAVFRRSGNRKRVSWILHHMATRGVAPREYERQRAYHEEAKAVAAATRSMPAEWPMTLALLYLNRGELSQARQELEEATAIVQTTGEPYGIVAATVNAGLLALAEGETERGVQLLAEATQQGLAAGIRRLLPKLYTAQALGARLQGDLLRGREFLAQAAGALREVGYREQVSAWLEEAGAQLSASGDHEMAAALLGKASHLRDSLPRVGDGLLAFLYDPVVGSVRQALGEPAFAEAWQRGRAMEIPAAMDEGLRALSRAGVSPRSRGPAWDGQGDPLSWLSPREIQIVRLVAQGRTDREVGARLFISPRTVDTYLRKIFRKAKVATRSAVAAWALRAGIDEAVEAGG